MTLENTTKGVFGDATIDWNAERKGYSTDCIACVEGWCSVGEPTPADYTHAVIGSGWTTQTISPTETTGWVCPKCEASNSPRNKTCANCTERGEKSPKTVTTTSAPEVGYTTVSST